jgi:acyl carrier protein
MALAICESNSDPRLAAMTVAAHEGVFSADLLPVLKSPTYRNMASQSRESVESERVDLQALFATEDLEVVREKIIQMITTQVARVLLFRKEDISPVRALSEMGLDSLMAVELALTLEECFDLHLSLKGSAGALTVTSLADEIIALANLKGRSPNESNIAELVGQHVKEVGPEDIELMREILND